MTAVNVDPRVAQRPATASAREQLSRVIGVVFVMDAVVLVLAVVLSASLKFGPGNWSPSEVEWLTGYAVVDFGWVVPMWLVTLAAQDAYSRRQFGRGVDELKTLFRGSVLAALLGAMLAYLVNYDMSRGFYLYYFLAGTTLLLGERYLVARYVGRMRRHDRLMHRVVVVGGDVEITAVRAVLGKRPHLGYEIVGACLTGGVGEVAVPVVGDAAAAVHACRRLGADTLLVLGGSVTSSSDLRRIGWELADSDIDLVVVPSLLDVAGPRIHMRPVSGLPFMHIEPPQAARAMKWGKSMFDRVGALVLLIVLAPVLFAVAVAVRMEGGGPVLFQHRRVGLAGQEFGVWKIRSMVTEAEELHADLVEQNGSGALLFKLECDPRVTRVGWFLRRYSLDELPQLFNVLVGEMSLVGPRPQVVDEVARYGDADQRRLLVRPGITGLWQVSGRSNLTWDEAVRLDLYYVDNWSMAGDLAILFKTIRAVFRADGAY